MPTWTVRIHGPMWISTVIEHPGTSPGQPSGCKHWFLDTWVVTQADAHSSGRFRLDFFACLLPRACCLKLLGWRRVSASWRCWRFSCSSFPGLFPGFFPGWCREVLQRVLLISRWTRKCRNRCCFTYDWWESFLVHCKGNQLHVYLVGSCFGIWSWKCLVRD